MEGQEATEHRGAGGKEIEPTAGIIGQEVDEFGRAKSLLEWRRIEFDRLDHEAREWCVDELRQGRISWFLHPGQTKLLEWLDAEPRELSVICIPRQFGKSFMMIAYCIAFAIRHPRVTVLFLAPSKEQVRKIVLPRINEVFSYLPDELVPVRRGHTWTFAHNGSTFRIDGVNVSGGDRLRGDTAHLIVMDECREVPELKNIIDNTVMPMFTTTDGRLVLISTPPESPGHAFTKKYVEDAKESGAFYTCTYRDNPLLSVKRLRYLLTKAYPGGEANPSFRREYMADYTVTDPDKKVVREWNRADNDTWFEEYGGPGNQLVRPYTLMDYAHNDPCGLLFGYYDPMEACLVIEDEHFERRMNTDDVGRTIVEKESELHGRLPHYADPRRIMDIDPSLMADLRQRHGLRFEPVHKIPNNTAMLNRLRSAFADGRIRIHPRCEKLRHQLDVGIFNKKGDDYVKTDDTGHLDLIDALKYGVLNTRWSEMLRAEDVALEQNQILVAPNPFKKGSFTGGVLRRPS